MIKISIPKFLDNSGQWLNGKLIYCSAKNNIYFQNQLVSKISYNEVSHSYLITTKNDIHEIEGDYSEFFNVEIF